jgi:hypothetical protein
MMPWQVRTSSWLLIGESGQNSRACTILWLLIVVLVFLFVVLIVLFVALIVLIVVLNGLECCIGGADSCVDRVIFLDGTNCDA